MTKVIYRDTSIESGNGLRFLDSLARIMLDEFLGADTIRLYYTEPQPEALVSVTGYGPNLGFSFLVKHTRDKAQLTAQIREWRDKLTS